MSRQVRISAIAVATVDGMPRENYARALRLTELAVTNKPDLILLPEAFASGYCGTELRPYAEPVDSAALEKFRVLSREADCMIVVGCLMPGEGQKVRNAAVLFDQGKLIGIHYKSTLWSDNQRPYRDECTLMLQGPGVEVFPTRLGRIAVLICYENMIQDNWRKLPADAELILSPYNCEDDPGIHNINGSKLIGRPSAWANRTGTVYGGDAWRSNPGTAGIVDANGRELVHSAPGSEEIVHATVVVGASSGD